jgi:hypothetical protein
MHEAVSPWFEALAERGQRFPEEPQPHREDEHLRKAVHERPPPAEEFVGERDASTRRASASVWPRFGSLNVIDIATRTVAGRIPRQSDSGYSPVGLPLDPERQRTALPPRPPSLAVTG